MLNWVTHVGQLGWCGWQRRLPNAPAGRSWMCFAAEQQGAYDVLGNENVRSAEILDAMQAATVRRCDDEPWVHVVVDGTSLRFDR